MRLGYNTNGFAHHRLEDAIGIIAELGYRSVAISLDHHALNPYEEQTTAQAERVGKLLDRHGLHCVLETGARFILDPRRKHYPSLLDPTGEQRARRRDFTCRAIDLGARLRAKAVSLWSGAQSDDVNEAGAMGRLVEECKRIAEHAERADVRLAFEPEPGMFIDTMARFADLHARVNHPLFGLTLDVGHVHCLGDGEPAAHIREWRERLFNVHVEDMRRGVHDHLMFGEGEMAFGPIFEALREVPGEVGVHVELSRHSHDAVETARKSIAFLEALKS